MNKIVATLVLVLLTTPALAGRAVDDIQVDDPWVREMPPNMNTSAGFLTLVNRGRVDHSLIAARSPLVGSVELHTHINDKGVMRMRPVREMKVPAGGRTELKPGGLHLMLMRIKRTFKAGDKVPVTLIFEDGSRMTIEAEVRRFDMMMQGGMRQQMPMKMAH